MRLERVARAFDKTVCSDGYTGEELFKAQIGLYDDTKRDSEVGERRIFSMAGDIEFPTRRVIEAAGRRWILGHENIDTHSGRVIRKGVIAHEATWLSSIYTLGELLRGEEGTQAWAGGAWIKNAADNEESSDLTPQFHLHHARGESIAAGVLIEFDGRFYLVRTCWQGPAGTLISLADVCPAYGAETVALTGTSYDRVADSMTTSTVNVAALRLRWQSLYEYRNNEAPKFGPADLQLAILKTAATVRAGQRATLGDGSYMIESALDEGDVWLCRAVRHA